MTGEVATPFEFVVAVAVLEEVPLNVPLAPVAGAVNVTVRPGTGLEALSSTVALRGNANAVLTVAVCGVPPVAVMVACDEEDVLVRLKEAGIDTPTAVAVTL